MNTLSTHDDFENALKAVKAEVPSLNYTDDTRDCYIPRRRLRYWFNSTKSPKVCKVVPASTSTRRTKRSASKWLQPYVPHERAIIMNTLSTHGDFLNALKAMKTKVPSLNYTDHTRDFYIPRRRLLCWFNSTKSPNVCKVPPASTSTRRTKRSANDSSDQDRPLNNPWEHEASKFFAAKEKKPTLRTADMEERDLDHEWTNTSSWTFCPACGRHRPKTQIVWNNVVPCLHGCDNTAKTLLLPFTGDADPQKLQAYVTPQEADWKDMLAHHDAADAVSKTLLGHVDVKCLQVIDLFVDYKNRRGGKAGITSKQKSSVVRAEWCETSLLGATRSAAAEYIFLWLMDNNMTYRHYVTVHDELCRKESDPDSRRIQTAKLLLGMPGIEVAIRPWLYPLASFADTDILGRLQPLNHLSPKSNPSMRASFTRKMFSRCIDYGRDFHLQSLLYDVAMSKTISSIVAKSISTKIVAEHLAADMDNFEEYWHRQLTKMEDICRLEYETHEIMQKALPNVFFTVAPAEWTFRFLGIRILGFLGPCRFRILGLLGIRILGFLGSRILGFLGPTGLGF